MSGKTIYPGHCNKCDDLSIYFHLIDWVGPEDPLGEAPPFYLKDVECSRCGICKTIYLSIDQREKFIARCVKGGLEVDEEGTWDWPQAKASTEEDGV